MTSPRRDDRHLETLFEAARQHGDGQPPSTEAHWNGRSRIVEAARARRRPRRAWRLALAAAALVGVALLVVWLWPETPAPPDAARTEDAMAWEIEGDRVDVNRSTLETRDAPATVTFDASSRVDLDAETRLVVDSSNASDARLVLERGGLSCDIVHRDGATWRVEAGPWTVHVVGTRFDVDWTPETGAFEVTLHEGRVEITGPEQTRPVVLEAGTRLITPGTDAELRVVAVQRPELDVPAPETQTPRVTPAEVDVATPVAVDEVVVERRGATQDVAPPRAPRRRDVHEEAVAIGPDWRALLEAGDFEAIVTSARAGDLQRTLAAAQRTDLMTLAEAARYAGDTALAREALEALRERFADHDDAATAAFLLGRLAEQAGEHGRAAAWYGTALEASSGDASFVPDAMGRRMLSLERSGALDAARAQAEAYLDRHPAGAWASTARRILGD